MGRVTRSRSANVNLSQPIVVSAGPFVGSNATFRRPIHVLPYNARLLQAEFVTSATIAANADDYWTFSLTNADGSVVYTSTRASTVAGGAVTAGIVQTLAAVSTSVAEVADGAPLYFSAVLTASGATQAATYFSVTLSYVPR